MSLRFSLRQISRAAAVSSVFLIFFLSLPLEALASNSQVTLAWDPNSEPDMAGYNVYYGTSSGTYSFVKDVGLQTSCTLTGLSTGNYYAVITAYNSSGVESSYSNEVQFSVTAATAGNGTSNDGTVAAGLPQSLVQLPGGGAAGSLTTGPQAPLQSGYATVTATTGSPYPIAVLSYAQDSVVSSEAAFEAANPVNHAEFPVEHRVASGISIRTCMALVNTGSADIHVQLVLRDRSGNAFPAQSLVLKSREHVGRFVDALFTMSDDFGVGSLELSSDGPISATAFRMTFNQAGRMLMSCVPMIDLSTPAPAGPLYFAEMTDGNGFRTSLTLFNATASAESGTIQFLDASGSPLGVTIGGSAVTGASYSIAPGGAFTVQTDGTLAQNTTGWIRIIPDSGSPTPRGAEVIGRLSGGVLISETSLPPAIPTNHVVVYIDESGSHKTGLAIANPASQQNSDIALAVYQSWDVQNAYLRLNLPANGSENAFLADLFNGSLPAGFTGIVDITSPEPFLVSSLRFHDSIFTNMPFENIGVTAPGTVLPEVVDGGGYQTGFMLLNPGVSDSSVQLNFWDDSGNPIDIGR